MPSILPTSMPCGTAWTGWTPTSGRRRNWTISAGTPNIGNGRHELDGSSGGWDDRQQGEQNAPIPRPAAAPDLAGQWPLPDLHGDCLYDGDCNPQEFIIGLIHAGSDYIQDAEQWLPSGLRSPSSASQWYPLQAWRATRSRPERTPWSIRRGLRRCRGESASDLCPGPPVPAPTRRCRLGLAAGRSQAISATDFQFSGSSYHFFYHSGSSPYQFQTSLLLSLRRSIPLL